MDDIIAIEYDITPNIANMLKLGQDLADMTNRAESIAVQLATANEARQQLQDALHVRDTQLAAATQRAEAAESELQGFRQYADYQRTTDRTPPLTYDQWCEWQHDIWRRERDGQVDRQE